MQNTNSGSVSLKSFYLLCYATVVLFRFNSACIIIRERLKRTEIWNTFWFVVFEYISWARGASAGKHLKSNSRWHVTTWQPQSAVLSSGSSCAQAAGKELIHYRASLTADDHQSRAACPSKVLTLHLSHAPSICSCCICLFWKDRYFAN